MSQRHYSTFQYKNSRSDSAAKRAAARSPRKIRLEWVKEHAVVDNFRFDITGEGDLTLAMRVAFSHHQRAEGFWIRPPANGKAHRLVLFHTEPQNPTLDPRFKYYKKFDFEVNADAAAEIARRFLLKAEYEPEPEFRERHTPMKGWRVYNEQWKHVDGEWQAFVAIAPAWVTFST